MSSRSSLVMPISDCLVYAIDPDSGYTESCRCELWHHESVTSGIKYLMLFIDMSCV